MSQVVDLLKQDHRKVEQLFKQFQQTNDPDLATQICGELTAHAILEEELIYPILRNQVNKQDAEHAQEEHDDAKKLIARIQEMEPTDPELIQTMRKLEEGITHHVEEEEGQALPEMEQSASTELEAIEAKFTERKQQLAQVFVEKSQGQDLLDLTKEELYQRAQEMSVAGRSEMTKEELIAALHSPTKS